MQTLEHPKLEVSEQGVAHKAKNILNMC